MSRKKYTDLFFDLDRTIWDFEKNAEDTLHELFEEAELSTVIPDFQTFYSAYKEINMKLWDAYRETKISKQELNFGRFYKTLLSFNIDSQEKTNFFAREYVARSPQKTVLFPGAVEVLEYLAGKYTLHVITNGFEEVQFKKIEISDLKKFFSVIVTSEAAGCKKPDRRIFDHALVLADASAESCLMIGDDPEVDIAGAANCGIDQVLFDPYSEHNGFPATFRVENLLDMKEFL